MKPNIKTDVKIETKDMIPTTHKRSALVALAARMGVEADALFLDSLRSVAFQAPGASNEQLLALCVVANQYALNPFLRELYAFPSKGGGVVPIVSVDGWARIINDSPQFDGMAFLEAEDGSWCECIIHRKDRSHPLRAREYLAECRRATDPWRSHPRRMLRHKAMIQAARLAFGFSGICDADEAERIIASDTGPAIAQSDSRIEQIKSVLGVAPSGDVDAGDGQLPIADINAVPPEGSAT